MKRIFAFYEGISLGTEDRFTVRKGVESIKRRIGAGIIILAVLVVAAFIFYSRYQTAAIRPYLEAGEMAVRYKGFESKEIPEVFLIKGESSKVVQKVVTLGFVDNITMLVSIGLESGEVKKVEILQHRESEDYGGYVTEDWFLNRFSGKRAGQPLTLVKMINTTNDEVVAITGATKTSAAVLAGVNLALENFLLIKGGL